MGEAGRSCIAALVLAAGSSTRFAAGNKLLAEVSGKPLIAWTITAFVEAGISSIFVVTGPEPERVQSALGELPVQFVRNPNHLAGMGGSIAAGVAALGEDIAAVLISPGDMPGISAELVRSLISAFEAGGGERIVRPLLPDGRPGHPVVWPRRFFPKLTQLSGPEGGRTLLRELASEIEQMPWSDPAVALDIDTVEELERYRAAKQEPHNS
ncbi:MAG: hypothetical protein DIU63_13345 [Proteobacteria bacterium]|jgi:molybdenum cofactor cytidylyltransferase|nr:MAG: hypothetical protein DIU63_13345 [Pseudomonadota bacterium]